LTQQQIPTLDEVLAFVDGCHSLQNARQFVINIEIKGSGIAGHVEEAITKRLKNGWKYGNFLVSSFDMGTLEELRNLNADIPVGVLFEGPLGDPHEPWDLEVQELEQCLSISRHLHPQTVNITLPSLTDEAVRIIRAIGATPVAWTCNEEFPDTLTNQTRRTIAEHMHRNSITLITDYPAEMIELLRSY